MNFNAMLQSHDLNALLQSRLEFGAQDFSMPERSLGGRATSSHANATQTNQRISERFKNCHGTMKMYGLHRKPALACLVFAQVIKIMSFLTIFPPAAYFSLYALLGALVAWPFFAKWHWRKLGVMLKPSTTWRVNTRALRLLAHGQRVTRLEGNGYMVLGKVVFTVPGIQGGGCGSSTMAVSQVASSQHVAVHSNETGQGADTANTSSRRGLSESDATGPRVLPVQENLTANPMVAETYPPPKGESEDAVLSARRFAFMYDASLRRRNKAVSLTKAHKYTLACDDNIRVVQDAGFPLGGLAMTFVKKQSRMQAGALSGGKDKLCWFVPIDAKDNVSSRLAGEDQGIISDMRSDRVLQQAYAACFTDKPPRFKKMLVELRRKQRQAAKVDSMSLKSLDGSQQSGQAGRAGGQTWHVPAVGAAMDYIGNMLGQNTNSEVQRAKETAHNLKEQADVLMQMEGAATNDVTVVVRVRPLSQAEQKRCEVHLDRRAVSIRGRTLQLCEAPDDSTAILTKPKSYTFDAVISEKGTSKDLCEWTGARAVTEVLRGVTSVIFAFGQTGSGKTYSLFGDGHKVPGVTQMAFDLLKGGLVERAKKECGTKQDAVEYVIECSILQVYLDQVYDLLGADPQQPLHLRSRVVEKTLTEGGGEVCEADPCEVHIPCRNAKEFGDVLERGIKGRARGCTNMNAQSSRSHCIVSLCVKRIVNLHDAVSKSAGRKHMSKLILVDLAGNERDSARSGAQDEARLKAEGIDVNASLTALSACLRQRAPTKRREASNARTKGQGVSKGPSEGQKVAKATASYRASTLTRLLKSPLMTAKIFFLGCCSPLASGAHTTQQTLTYTSMVKRIVTSAEDSAVLLEAGIHAFPIEFLPHEQLVTRNAIPRSSEKLTVFLHELRASVVRVMISHRWLSPSATPALAHPDKQGNPKHTLMCAVFRRMAASGWINSCDAVSVVEWLDFACINQDSHNPAEQLNGSMGRIIGSCDVMVTPVHDPEWRNWSDGEAEIKDAFVEYRAEAFVEYLKRGWCRLEMFFNANVPINSHRGKHFGGELRDVMVKEKRRPHLVFGTRELQKELHPVILRALRDDEFGQYHPGRGYLFDQRDALVIGAYVEELFKINRELRIHQGEGQRWDRSSFIKREVHGKTHGDTENFDDAEFLEEQQLMGGTTVMLRGISVWSSNMIKGIQSHFVITAPDGNITFLDGPKHVPSQKWGRMPKPERIDIDVSKEYFSSIAGNSGDIYDSIQIEVTTLDPAPASKEQKKLDVHPMPRIHKFGGTGGHIPYRLEVPEGHMIAGFFGGLGGDIHKLGFYCVPKQP